MVTRNSQNTYITTDTNNQVLMPAQPAFLATHGATTGSVTGDGTNYNVIFANEIFDQNSDYNNATGIFTAPVTGRYLLNGAVCYSNLGAAHTSGSTYIYTSNRTYYSSIMNAYAVSTGGLLGFTSGCTADMDAADSALCVALINNGAKTVQVYQSSYFSGVLIC